MFELKKSIAIILSLVIAITAALAACAKKEEGETTQADSSTASGSIMDADTEIGFEDIEVTDESGETVTDNSGTPVTTEVAVVYVTNNIGQVIGKVINEKGDVVTKKDGEEVTIIVNPETTTAGKDTTAKKDDDESSPSGKEDNTDEENTTDDTESETSDTTTTTKKHSTTSSTTNTTQKGDDTTATTAPDETTTHAITGVPKTTDSGKGCEFNAEDQQIIKHMLEVPYLYKASYEHEDGVPINIATHAALWMLQKDGLQATSYASGTVVIDLFKYFGRTVVGFKGKCNSEGDCENIQYNSANDVFTVTEFESEAYDIPSTHTVNNLRFEDLGNNYFKVIADVDGAKGVKKVIAIVEKNRLDNSLGFSIKALNWSK